MLRILFSEQNVLTGSEAKPFAPSVKNIVLRRHFMKKLQYSIFNLSVAKDCPVYYIFAEMVASGLCNNTNRK